MDHLPPGEPRPDARAVVPQEARLRLAHASVADRADEAGLRVLHFKGYAASDGVYREGRMSTDVDVLVEPARAEEMLEHLLAHGWECVADFAHGSVFGHAASMWHPVLGTTDVHHHFPGLGPDPAATFEALWAERLSRVVAGRTLPVPSLRHQRLAVIAHSARGRAHGRADVDHLRTTLPTDDWEQMRQAARELGAQAAWTFVTGEEMDGVDPDELAVFQAVDGGESGMDLLVTRWRAAGTPMARARVLVRAIPANRAHLALRLGRTPTGVDVAREQLARGRDLLLWILRTGVRRGR